MAQASRRFFVAGASGATGKFVVADAQARGLDFVAHYRPKRGAPAGVKNAAVLELDDAPALQAAMKGSAAVLQLIGTMQNRFASGDTYETSDIGTTRKLVNAAKATGVEHVILLSSLGAGRPMGSYLKAKAEAERIVRESGLGWTVFRPGGLWGGERKIPGAGGFESFAKALGLSALRPVRLEDLAKGLIASALENAPLNTVLAGKPFWEWVEHSRAP